MHVRKIWPRLFDRLCGRPLHFIDPTFAEPSPSLLDSWPLCAVKRIASASGAEGYRACRLGCGPETMVDSDVSLRRQRGMLSSPVSPSCRGTTSLLISKRFRPDAIFSSILPFQFERFEKITVGNSGEGGKVCYNLMAGNRKETLSESSVGWNIPSFSALLARREEVGNRIPVNRKYRLVLRPILLIAKFPALGERPPRIDHVN